MVGATGFVHVLWAPSRVPGFDTFQNRSIHLPIVEFFYVFSIGKASSKATSTVHVQYAAQSAVFGFAGHAGHALCMDQSVLRARIDFKEDLTPSGDQFAVT